jgi:hypothetical protein
MQDASIAKRLLQTLADRLALSFTSTRGALCKDIVLEFPILLIAAGEAIADGNWAAASVTSRLIWIIGSIVFPMMGR